MFLPGESQGWWRAAVYGVAQSRTRLKWLSSSSSSPWMYMCNSTLIYWLSQLHAALLLTIYLACRGSYKNTYLEHPFLIWLSLRPIEILLIYLTSISQLYRLIFLLAKVISTQYLKHPKTYVRMIILDNVANF